MRRNEISILFVMFLLVGLMLLVAVGEVGAYTYANVSPSPKFTALDSNGDPVVGGQLYTYETGTTTAKTTWTDASKATPNTNPVILDSRGQADVWIDASSTAYRFKLLDADGTTVWTVDDVRGTGVPITDFAATLLNDATAAEAMETLTYAANTYYVDASEADQGAAGSGRSLKDIIDAVGTSQSAMLVFSHSGSGNTTTYTVGTSETVPSNFRLQIEEGAILSIATGVTLTINGYVDSGPRHIFTCTGTGAVSFGEGSVERVYPEWWGNNTTPGTTDMTAEIQAALVAVPSGNVVWLSPYRYTVSSTLTISKYLKIFGEGRRYGGSEIECLTASDTVFSVEYGSCVFRDFGIKGDVAYGASAGTVVGIDVIGSAGAAGYAYDGDLTLENVSFYGLSKAVYQRSKNVIVRDCGFSSCDDGIYVDTAYGGGTSDYRGLFCERNRFHSQEGYCVYIDPAVNFSNVTITNNVLDLGVKGSALFGGFAGHLLIADNKVELGRSSLALIDSTGATLSNDYRKTTISGNIVSNHTTDNNDAYGVNVTGMNFLNISNNIFANLDKEAIKFASGGYGLITGNRFYECCEDGSLYVIDLATNYNHITNNYFYQVGFAGTGAINLDGSLNVVSDNTLVSAGGVEKVLNLSQSTLQRIHGNVSDVYGMPLWCNSISTGALSGATVSTNIQIPTGNVIVGVTLRVKTAVSDDAGDDTWTAQLRSNVTAMATLATGAAAAAGTEVQYLVDPKNDESKTTDAANILFTPNGGSFDGGDIAIMVWYYRYNYMVTNARG